MPSTMLYGTLPPGFSTGSQIPSAQPDPTQGGGLQATGGGAPPTYPPWAGSRTRRNTPQALPGVLPAPPASSIQATLQVGLFRLELTRLDSTFAPPYWVAQAWNSPWGVWSVLAELSDRARGEVMAFPPQVGHALLQAMVLIPIFWEHPEEALYAVLPFIIRLLHGRRLCFSASCACTHRRAAIRRCQRTTDAPAPVLKSVHTALTQPTRCHPVPTPRHTCRARTEAGPTRTAGPTVVRWRPQTHRRCLRHAATAATLKRCHGNNRLFSGQPRPPACVPKRDGNQQQGRQRRPFMPSAH